MEIQQSSSKATRIEWIDVAKGLLMLLVIWGHSTTSVEVHNYISSFYMSAFFILSGYTTREKLGLPLWKHIANRAISLLGPYLLFSCLWIAYSCLKSMIVPTDFSVTSAFISVFLPYSGRTNGSVYDFWFLPCMFLAHAIFCMIIYPYKQYKAFGIILWLVCLLVGMSIEHGSLLLCTSAAVMFIGVGYVTRKFWGGVRPLEKHVLCLIGILIHCISTYVNSWYLGNLVDFSSACFGNVALFIVSSVSGTIIWCYIAQILTFIRPLKFIGKNSLVYYGMHFFFTSAIGFLTDKTLIVVVASLLGTTITAMIYNKLKINELFKGRFTA